MTESLLVSMMKDILRGIINKAISHAKPSELMDCIVKGRSLWGEGKDSIENLSAKVPSFIMLQAADAIDGMYKYDDQGIYGVVRTWLSEDQPTLYSIIINTNGGDAWLDKQIGDILIGLGVVNNG